MNLVPFRPNGRSGRTWEPRDFPYTRRSPPYTLRRNAWFKVAPQTAAGILRGQVPCNRRRERLTGGVVALLSPRRLGSLTPSARATSRFGPVAARQSPCVQLIP